jgi:hypothetical protein
MGLMQSDAGRDLNASMSESIKVAETVDSQITPLNGLVAILDALGPAEIAGFALSTNCRFSAVHRG